MLKWRDLLFALINEESLLMNKGSLKICNNMENFLCVR